ncbi:hypothetical protein B0G80_3823 [Paraburkholderia sp. BL6669N2]|uniref:beta strand repeat-containing protein n=1 Tax=Paraburkholderia sp. BL6669N2 TaxID=1938807 RepID=UPI000E26A382|nr:DUF3060 domain-containing protein [Paraburkholderia sp. BL6669N2]REG60997.1 hypothetical protein B0G80_3823 [Paraburkholderia sp. BL6669N2]
MSTATYDVTLPGVSVSMDDATINVLSGASLNLTGSSDTVTMESGAGSVSVSGNNNTVHAEAIDGASITVSAGTGNVVTAGSGSWIADYGTGDTITVGANGSVRAGRNATVYATAGGDQISLSDGDTAYANSDSISLLTGGSATVSGNNNQISLNAFYNGIQGTGTLELSGSNNTIAFGAGALSVATSTGSFAEQASGGLVMTGGAAPSGLTLTGGMLSVQLDGGNVANLSGVTSGTQVEYIDASGVATWSTLMDTNLTHVSGNLYEVTASVSAMMSGATLDVLSGASLNLTGSSDTVTMESGAGSVSVSGNSNTVHAEAIDGASITVSAGTGNVVTAGSGSWIADYGTGDTITVGANGSVRAGRNATVYASAGGDQISLSDGDTAYANSDSISLLTGGSATVSGNNNQISLNAFYNGIQGTGTLELSGSNNTIAFGAGALSVATSTGSFAEQASGGLVMTGSAAPSGLTLTGGMLSVQLDGGNVAKLSGVTSGTQVEYIDASGVATWSTLMDTNLTHVSGNLYEVTASVSAMMSGATLDVLSGASLNLTGSSDTVTMESGAGSVSVSGNSNTVHAEAIDGASITVSAGTGNVVTAGSGSWIADYGTGDTITVGANGSVRAGRNATVYASAGGDQISLSDGDTAYANSDSISLLTGGSATVSGNNNQISLNAFYNGIQGTGTLELSGSNNRIAFGAGALSVATSTGSFAEQASGGLVMTGSAAPSGLTLTGGMLSVQLDGGNVANLSGVASGTQVEYRETAGSLSWKLYDTGVSPAGATIYDVSGDVSVAMSNATFNVLSGASLNLSGSSDVVDASSATIQLTGASSQVNGDGNHIVLGAGGNSLNLSGSNNSVSFSASSGQQIIQTSAGDLVEEDASGAIWFSSAAFSIKNGVVTLGFGDGNAVTISNVRSSANPSDSPTNQLVSAMAAYSNESGGASLNFVTQMPPELSLFASSRH